MGGEGGRRVITYRGMMPPPHLPTPTPGWATVTSHWDGAAPPSAIYCEREKEIGQSKGQGKAVGWGGGGASCNSRLGRRHLWLNGVPKAVRMSVIMRLTLAGGEV